MSYDDWLMLLSGISIGISISNIMLMFFKT